VGTDADRGSSIEGKGLTLGIFVTLCMLAFAGAAYAHGFVLTAGKGDPFCEALKEHVNRVNPKPPLQCTSDLIWRMPGVTEPEWTELKIEEHEALYKKILRFQMLPGEQYFTDKQRPETSPERLQRDYEQAVSEKNVRMLMTRMNVDLSDPEPETIVQLRWKGSCMTDRSKETASIVLVTSDLTEIDKKRMTKFPFIGYWQLVLYRAEPEFVSGGSGGEYGVASVRGYGGGLFLVCNLNSVSNTRPIRR